MYEGDFVRCTHLPTRKRALDPEQMGVVVGFSLRRGALPYPILLTWVPVSVADSSGALVAGPTDCRSERMDFSYKNILFVTSSASLVSQPSPKIGNRKPN